MFATPIDHLRAELERLDLLLHREILRLRAAYRLSLDEFRGLYVSDQQVDDLVRQGVEEGADHPTVEELSERVSERAHLVTEIDLQTHTRWIRDADPLNIYRYRKNTWRTFGFSGIPNRVRPDTYFESLERHNWCDLRAWPQRVLPAEYVAEVEPALARQFRGDPEHLAWLSVVLCASRRGERCWREVEE